MCQGLNVRAAALELGNARTQDLKQDLEGLAGAEKPFLRPPKLSILQGVNS